MIIICLMGRSGSGKSLIEDKIAKLGYNRSISYTTKEQGVGEVNGEHYHFVSKEDFFKLVDKNIIMEYAEYAGNFYGSPHPIGTINNVLVVEPNGYESIKKIYGRQVVGVYIDVPAEVADERATNRNRTDEEDMKKRKSDDDIIFNEIKDNVDLIVDGTKEVDCVVADIFKYVAENRRY